MENLLIIIQITFRNCREHFFFSTVFLETALYTKSDFSVSEKIIYREVCTPFMSPFIYCKIIALFCIGPNAQYRIANSQCLKKPLLNQLYAISDSHNDSHSDSFVCENQP